VCQGNLILTGLSNFQGMQIYMVKFQHSESEIPFKY